MVEGGAQEALNERTAAEPPPSSRGNSMHYRGLGRQMRFRGVLPSQAKPAAVARRIVVVRQPPSFGRGIRYVVRPAGPVTARVDTYGRPSCWTRPWTVARETKSPVASRAATLTSTPFRRTRYVIDTMLRRPGTTCSVAVAETGSVPFSPVAVTVAEPRARPAVNLVSLPSGVESIPIVEGSRTQVAFKGTLFPKESEPVAASRCEPRAGTSALAGVTAKVTIDPGRTVSTCVPFAAPSAAAVSV
jgi:hypothetical protein